MESEGGDHRASSGIVDALFNLPARGRRPIRIPCSAALLPGRRSSLVLVNVSVGGVSCETYSAAPAGSQIVLDFNGVGQIPAIVRWSHGNRFGARFSDKLDLPQKQIIAKLVRMSISAAAQGALANASATHLIEQKACNGTDREEGGWQSQLDRVLGRQLQLLAELQEATGFESPEPARLADVRLRLTRLSGSRRELTERGLIPELERLSAPRATRLAGRLRANDAALRAVSAQHIGTWSLDAVLRDWRGYCAASAKVQNALQSQIQLAQEGLSLCRLRQRLEPGR